MGLQRLFQESLSGLSGLSGSILLLTGLVALVVAAFAVRALVNAVIRGIGQWLFDGGDAAVALLRTKGWSWGIRLLDWGGSIADSIRKWCRTPLSPGNLAALALIWAGGLQTAPHLPAVFSPAIFHPQPATKINTDSTPDPYPDTNRGRGLRRDFNVNMTCGELLMTPPIWSASSGWNLGALNTTVMTAGGNRFI